MPNHLYSALICSLSLSYLGEDIIYFSHKKYLHDFIRKTNSFHNPFNYNQYLAKISNPIPNENSKK